MRSRRHQERLEKYYKVVNDTILKHQDLHTGLIASSASSTDAWIRDNVYCISAVWALASAYKAASDQSEDMIKTYHLEQNVVRCMRGLLLCMMRQSDRLERFKNTSDPKDSLHAKFSVKTGRQVVGDEEWGHLQIDAVSLYLLFLAQMTASGLEIVTTLEEVALVQNLVFIIEAAYCTPDYGIWERGDKTNTGSVELNASSIGMAKAALDAMNELNLFGSKGGPTSVVHVLPDEAQKCQAVLESMLPRESLSKETDASLLTVVGFPAFAVEKPELVERTVDEVLTKLGGKYGCKRFLRDGYKNPREDQSRLYYESWELRLFENIECQWPLFYCYLAINACFQRDRESFDKYFSMLKSCMVPDLVSGGMVVPELYSVPEALVTMEEVQPGSQERVAAGRVPFMWATALYVIARLMDDNLLAVGELDPLNRRMSAIKRPAVNVQVVVLARDRKVQSVIAKHGFEVDTLEQVMSDGVVNVHNARVLSFLYSFLGRSEKLGLTGRASKDVGVLTTSKLYKVQGKLFAFTPQRFDVSRNYVDCDVDMMIKTLEYGLNYLSTYWRASGRPLMTLVMNEAMLENGNLHPSVLKAMRKLRDGYINETRVRYGRFEEFISTACIVNLSFLGCSERGHPEKMLPQIERFLSEQTRRSSTTFKKIFGRSFTTEATGSLSRKRVSIRGSLNRSRSLIVSDSRGPSPTYSKQSSIDDDEGSQHTTPSGSESNLNVASAPVFDAEEIVQHLADATSQEEQADILHYLVNIVGLGFKIPLSQGGEVVEIRDLLKTLYEAAVAMKNWAVVRHSAGVLGRRVDDLSKSVTDLLVNLKLVTVGVPPNNEVVVTERGLKTADLLKVIVHSFGDASIGMLAQELIVYLAMLLQTEPKLFHGMLRLRIGLIIQVMAQEVSSGLKIAKEEGINELMRFSPSEMRNLLHHIMAGFEFQIMKRGETAEGIGYRVVIEDKVISKNYLGRLRLGSTQVQQPGTSKGAITITNLDSDEDDDDDQMEGYWQRRRRLDGALNRVPHGFYTKVWKVLEKCQSLRMQTTNALFHGLTQEMTSGELKFALRVEMALNTVPVPELRQLMVETLLVLYNMVEYRTVEQFGGSAINVEEIVREANRIFLQDQRTLDADAILCCAQAPHASAASESTCGSPAGICKHFYDSAPSGRYGTMTYIVRACCTQVEALPKEGVMECPVS